MFFKINFAIIFNNNKSLILPPPHPPPQKKRKYTEHTENVKVFFKIKVLIRMCLGIVYLLLMNLHSFWSSLSKKPVYLLSEKSEFKYIPLFVTHLGVCIVFLTSDPIVTETATQPCTAESNREAFEPTS